MIDFINLKEQILQGEFKNQHLNYDEDALKTLSSVFFYLSLCFRYPDEEIYQKITELSSYFKAFFEDYIDKTPEISPQEEMEPEYVRLFVSNYGGVIAVPYASYYKEEEKLLMGESTVELKELMENEGIVLKKDIKEVEDHIYIILEMCSIFINKIIDSKKINNESANTIATLFKVIYHYLIVFKDEFCDNIINDSNLDFYIDLAKTLKGFIADIDTILEDVFMVNDRL